MRYEVQLKLENQHRMLSRVLQVLDHVQAVLEHLTFDSQDEQLYCRLIVEVEHQRGDGMKALLWKIHGLININMMVSPRERDRLHGTPFENDMHKQQTGFSEEP